MKEPFSDADKVKAINEIYHDLEAEYYVHRHPEIYTDEKVTWEYIGENFLRAKKELVVLDIGTGAGFVPLCVSRYLKENDKIICTDLSDKMLKVAQTQMSGLGKIRKEFIKADALAMAKTGLKVDVITMNSVLHHIPDYEVVLPQLARLINPGGYFIIMHERNKRYCQKGLSWLAFYHHLARINVALRKCAKKILLSLGVYKKKHDAWDEFNVKVCQVVNARKVVDQELTSADINAIVDFHDPDERGEGFDPFVLHKEFFPDFKVAAMATYKHLGAWVNEDRGLINKVFSGKIKKDDPYAGALFWLVMQKREE